MYSIKKDISSTYDHRMLEPRLPVRSALFKQCTGGLVVRWVTTSEYPLLYVFFFLLHRDLVVISTPRYNRDQRLFSSSGVYSKQDGHGAYPTRPYSRRNIHTGRSCH
ncbi:hypothetical protein BU25DRAFT_474344 [Macroventuria anomochaeta]|uniref:Uncharacterized protein n=1 Tax=Macroventuria anomochaeta TaxID=301207 RepID=A0ACB6RUP7_9PLEO|nr:hypothetical protein BU25DRAFT_474344 [Macroventuria anomochaeta]